MLCACRAEKFTVAGEGLQMVALPVAYVADLQEAWKLLGQRSSGTLYPDLNCLVPKHKLDDPHGVYLPRTVAAARQVCPWPLHGRCCMSMLPLIQPQAACCPLHATIRHRHTQPISHAPPKATIVCRL